MRITVGVSRHDIQDMLRANGELMRIMVGVRSPNIWEL
jgi:hypothetical protein